MIVINFLQCVFSEWRTFSNDKDSKDRSRVGDVENRLLSSSGSDLSTMIGPMGNGQMNEGWFLYISNIYLF